MRKVESINMKYVGYEKPETKTELEFEIAGLETLIALAQQRIALLKQGLKLKELTCEEEHKEH